MDWRALWEVCLRVEKREFADMLGRYNAPVNEKTSEGRKEMMKFGAIWNENIKVLQNEGRVVTMGVMSAKVGNEQRENVVGKWDGDETN